MVNPVEFRKTIDAEAKRAGLNDEQIKLLYILNGIESRSGTATESAYYSRDRMFEKFGGHPDSSLGRYATKMGWYDKDGKIVGESVTTANGKTIPKKLWEWAGSVHTALSKDVDGNRLSKSEINDRQQELFNTVYGGRIGNTEDGDGWKYRGRGGVQLTGRANYETVTKILNKNGIDIDLVANPELAADKRYSAAILLAFAEHRGMFNPKHKRYISPADIEAIKNGDKEAIDKLHDITNPDSSNKRLSQQASKVYDNTDGEYDITDGIEGNQILTDLGRTDIKIDEDKEKVVTQTIEGVESPDETEDIITETNIGDENPYIPLLKEKGFLDEEIPIAISILDAKQDPEEIKELLDNPDLLREQSGLPVVEKEEVIEDAEDIITETDIIEDVDTDVPVDEVVEDITEGTAEGEIPDGHRRYLIQIGIFKKELTENTQSKIDELIDKGFDVKRIEIKKGLYKYLAYKKGTEGYSNYEDSKNDVKKDIFEAGFEDSFIYVEKYDKESDEYTRIKITEAEALNEESPNPQVEGYYDSELEEEVIEEEVEEEVVKEEVEISDEDKREGLKKEILGAYGETYLDGYFSFNSEEEAVAHYQEGEYSWTANDLIMIDGKKYESEWNYDKDRWDFKPISDENWNTRVEEKKEDHSKNIDFQVQSSIENEEWEIIEEEELEEKKQENIEYYNKHKKHIDQLIEENKINPIPGFQEFIAQHEGRPIEEWSWVNALESGDITLGNLDSLNQEVEHGWEIKDNIEKGLKYDRLDELKSLQDKGRVLSTEEQQELDDLLSFQESEKFHIQEEAEAEQNFLDYGIRESNADRELRLQQEQDAADLEQQELEENLRLEQEEKNKIALPEDKTVQSYTEYSLRKAEELKSRKELINTAIKLRGEDETANENEQAELDQIDKNLGTLNHLNQYLTVLKEYSPNENLENFEVIDNLILEGKDSDIRKELNVIISQYKDSNSKAISDASKGIYPEDIKGDPEREKEYIESLKTRKESLEKLSVLETPYFSPEDLENMSINELFVNLFEEDFQEDAKGYFDRIESNRTKIADYGDKHQGSVDIYNFVRENTAGADGKHILKLEDKRWGDWNNDGKKTTEDRGVGSIRKRKVVTKTYDKDYIDKIGTRGGPIEWVKDLVEGETSYTHTTEPDGPDFTHDSKGNILMTTKEVYLPNGKTLYFTEKQWAKLKEVGPKTYMGYDNDGNFKQHKINYDDGRFGWHNKTSPYSEKDIKEFNALGVKLHELYDTTDMDNAIYNLTHRGKLKEEFKGTNVETLLYGGTIPNTVEGQPDIEVPGLLGPDVGLVTKNALTNLYTMINEGQEIDIANFMTEHQTVYSDLETISTETEEGVEIDEERSQGLSGQEVLKGTMDAAKGILDAFGGPDALIGAVLGKKALTQAMKDVTPQERAKLSPMFNEHLRQVKELQKRGFHPSEEQKIRKEIDTAYQMGLENTVRGTAGDRAKFLAASGILDAKRSSALLEFASQDADLQRQNQKNYQDVLMFKENFDATQKEQLRQENLQMQLANKKAASEFAGLTLGSALGGFGGSNAIMDAIMKKTLDGYFLGKDKQVDNGLHTSFDNGNNNDNNNNNNNEEE